VDAFGEELVTQIDVPSPPLNIQAKDITDCSVHLMWSPPLSSNGSNVVGYIIERKSDDMNHWRIVGQVDTTTSYTATDLLSDKKYSFRISAINSVGEGRSSNIIDVHTGKSGEVGTATKAYAAPVEIGGTDLPSEIDVPSPPLNIQAKDVTDCSAQLLWSPPLSSNGADVTGYVIERKSDDMNHWRIVGRVDATLSSGMFYG
jgi:titin